MTRTPDVAGEVAGVAFLLPGAIRRARAALGRLGLVTRLLGAARDRTLDPSRPAPDLGPEREAVGIDDATLDDVVIEAARVDGGLRVPQAARLHRLLVEGLDEALEPLAVAEGQARGGGAAALRDRLHG